MSARILGAKRDELQSQQMKEVDIPDVGKILLIRDGDNFYATGSKCSHYGLPLKSGVYHNGKVRCCFHGACFNVQTGDIEDYPTLTGIHVFQTEVLGDEVWISYEPQKVKDFKRVVDVTCPVTEDQRVFVLIGGGPAAVICADTLREKHFKGRIILLTREKYLPTERIKLSKTLTSTPDQVALHSREYYGQANIEVRVDSEVTSIDTSKNELSLKNGEKVKYDQLLIASGGDPRRLTIPGSDLGNIFCLREVEEANGINNVVKSSSNVVVIGSSFIGMEIAATLTGKVASISVVGRGVPFERVLGRQVGAVMKQLSEEKGLKFISKSPTEFKGADGVVQAVVFDDGTEVPADVVVLGIGVAPATSYVPENISKHADGSIIVDEFMRTSVPNVYAAGDLAHFRYPDSTKSLRIEHWAFASKQGKVAALNMLEPNSAPLTAVPYFWCMIFGKSVRYTGHASHYDEVIFHQDKQDPYKFVAYYVEKGKIAAVSAMTAEPVVSAAAELFRIGRIPTVDQVRSADFNLVTFLAK
eukprot:TRINITY_DN800_c0_g1_i1.p1 TRINITY_DN800_c0_g1~~TRINITY_DN800_c0_g1_i1.p1  ORF type:complete len:543 (-),score=146.79 TRINITY_DN800_c0_g1_i1:41-1627(-)